MKMKLLLSIVLAVFVMSCGKNDEPKTEQQTTPQQQTIQQNQTPQQNNDGTPQLTEAEKKKEEDKKKEEEKKKADEKKKEENIKKEELTNQNHNTDASTDINFAEIWPKKCAKCHGKDGKGKLEGVPDLTRGEIKSKSDKQLISIITNGKQGETEESEDMPSFKNKLSEDEIKAAARFVKGF